MGEIFTYMLYTLCYNLGWIGVALRELKHIKDGRLKTRPTEKAQVFLVAAV